MLETSVPPSVARFVVPSLLTISRFGSVDFVVQSVVLISGFGFLYLWFDVRGCSVCWLLVLAGEMLGLLIVVACVFAELVGASVGDRSQMFHTCLQSCITANCTGILCFSWFDWIQEMNWYFYY